MKNINSYILEKFKLHKGIQLSHPDFESWVDYIESIGGEVVELNTGVYAIYLENSEDQVRYTDIYYTYPYIKIETTNKLKDDINTESCWYFHDVSKSSSDFIAVGVGKDKRVTINYQFPTDKLKKCEDDKRDGIYDFNKENADYLIEVLNIINS